jgi:hypothetical protein
MFGTKKGAVAKALVLAPIMGKKSAKGKSAMVNFGTNGKAATASGKKAK